MNCKIIEQFNQISLSKRFFIISFISLLVILLIFNILIVKNFKNVFIAREKKIFKQLIETSVKQHLRLYVYKYKWDKSFDFTLLINEIKKLPNIYNVSFYTSNGDLITALKLIKQNKDCVFKEGLEKAKKGIFYVKFYKINGRMIQMFFYPFVFKGKVNGIIQVCKNPDELLKQVNFVRNIVLLISFTGFLLYLFFVYVIITKIERREQLLQDKVIQYQRLSCLGHFSAKMSHELGTPLHVIQGNVELIGDLVKDDFVIQRINIVNRQINKINNIIRNYLYLAKNPVPEYNFFFLKEFLLQIIDEFSSYVPDNIEMNVEIDDVNVYSDKEFIELILYNFIKNAIDSIGEQSGTITIKSYKVSESINIEVIDTGKGFSEKIKEQLFEPFFTTKKTGKGTGLGLSVCKDLVTALGGEIYCSSKNKETVFGIKIPIKAEYA